MNFKIPKRGFSVVNPTTPLVNSTTQLVKKDFEIYLSFFCHFPIYKKKFSD